VTRNSYDEVITEIGKEKTINDSLSNLRREAEQLLGISTSPQGGKPQPEMPKPDASTTQR